MGEQAPKVLTSPVCIYTGGSMSETTITGAQLEKIGEYVRGQLPQWLQENGVAPLPDQSTDHPNDLVIQAPIALAERIVRVEEALKHQTDFLKTMLKQMDKRFEENRQYADKRFEDMNRRFEENRQYSDKRFEEARQHNDSRFNQMIAFLTAILIVLGSLITFFGLST